MTKSAPSSPLGAQIPGLVGWDPDHRLIQASTTAICPISTLRVDFVTLGVVVAWCEVVVTRLFLSLGSLRLDLLGSFSGFTSFTGSGPL